MRCVFLASAILAGMTATAGSLAAQDNLYPITLVDESGVERPLAFEPVIGRDIAQYEEESIYLALDPATPSGNYYVHVTDRRNGVNDVVLSQNDPLDRFVTVINMGGGLIILDVPNNPTLEMGVGLNGIGDSLPLGFLGENTEDHCMFKVWLSDTWTDPLRPDDPYTLLGGGVRSYSYFRIGDGSGSTISGIVFDDFDADGEQDAGEPGLAGVEVQLIQGGSTTSTTTASDGSYAFTSLGHGEYEVVQVLETGRTATTPSSVLVSAIGCGLVTGPDFGQNLKSTSCDGHTIGFWRNRHGVDLILTNGLLADLGSLNVVDGDGGRFTTNDIDEYRTWMRKAESTNMAYMLSAQLTAMHFNVSVGFVGAGCMIDDPNLGQVTISSVMDAAIQSLATDPYTPQGHAQRDYQEQLKHALDAANNNSNWL